METYLINKAKEIRKKILETNLKNGGHLASSLSCVDILVLLYFGKILNYDVAHLDWDDRDYFILSKGHAEIALYEILADTGFFPQEWIASRYRKGDHLLGAHPDIKIPGVEATTGSLGHGLGIAAGMALAAKYNKKENLHFVLLGDAECTEGSVWESAIFSAKHNLNNLIAIIDYNRISALDFTGNFTELEPFEKKWLSFGWSTQLVDGHDMRSMYRYFSKCRNRRDNRPLAIIANTIKGKGISFMENDPKWHTQTLTEDNLIKQALKELD